MIIDMLGAGEVIDFLQYFVKSEMLTDPELKCSYRIHGDFRRCKMKAGALRLFRASSNVATRNRG